MTPDVGMERPEPVWVCPRCEHATIGPGICPACRGADQRIELVPFLPASCSEQLEQRVRDQAKRVRERRAENKRLVASIEARDRALEAAVLEAYDRAVEKRPAMRGRKSSPAFRDSLLAEFRGALRSPKGRTEP